jgi:hypothetical protein
MCDNFNLEQVAQSVLDALHEYENLIEGEQPGPVAWSLFDPQIGRVATLRSFYPPHQLPDPGQELYRNLSAALPAEEEWDADTPLRPEHAHRIFHHLDRFRAWLVKHYRLAGPQAKAPAQPDEDDPEAPPGRIPPARRTRPLSISEAARLMGYRGNKKQAAKQLKSAMNAGAIAFERLSRQRYVFDRLDFPEESWPRLTPTGLPLPPARS